MSDTPKTDANCGWPVDYKGRIECSDLRWSPDGPFVHSSVARELERENAALKKDKEMLEMERCECLRTMDLALNESSGLRQALEAQSDYQRDLRADRDRIDWILSDDGGFFIWWNYDIEEWTPELKATRDWIDIAMKEKR